jgi:hypothetical protein
MFIDGKWTLFPNEDCSDELLLFDDEEKLSLDAPGVGIWELYAI